MKPKRRTLSYSSNTACVDASNASPSAETTISGLEMRSAFSLRSTTFDIVVTPQFDDVSAGHRFAGEVLGLSELGITSGCTALSFCPERPVTRAEMAAFLIRSLA